MNRTMVTALLAGITLAFPAPSLGQTGDGFVGIYEDAAGTQPCSQIPPWSGKTLHVVASLAGASVNGITGAEFRIEVTNPSGWFVSYAAPNGSTPLGNPIDIEPTNPDDGSGLTIAFSECRVPDASGRVTLGTIAIYNAGASSTLLLVKRHSRPSNESYPCPLFVLCDAPVYSKVCMTPSTQDPCSLSVEKTASHDPSDVPVFSTSLNASGGGNGNLPPEPLVRWRDDLVQFPTLVQQPVEQDIVQWNPGGPPGSSKVLQDTLWSLYPDWSFDPDCTAPGWTHYDNRVLNDGSNYWNVSTEYDGIGGIVGNAAVLKRFEPCWADSGYGNNWDYAIVAKYRGCGAVLSFDFLCDSEEFHDWMTIEADSGCASEERVDYVNRPHMTAADYRTLLYSADLSGSVQGLNLPGFGCSYVTHCVYIRFHSDGSVSDEDALKGFSSSIGAGLVVDNIEVGGGYLEYTEMFEGALNPNVTFKNSAPAESFGEWARLFSHVTDNDKCAENTTCSWLFTDPVKIAYYADMAFGPGAAIVRNWLDGTLVSPWVQLNGQQPPNILSFRLLPGQKWDYGRIVLGLSIRGKKGSCVTSWSDETRNYAWEGLDGFGWVTRIYEPPFVDPGWTEMQVRFRVSDWQYIFDGPPPSTVNTGPGPYVDRVRLGKIPRDLVFYVGPDTRYQAQDAFPEDGTLTSACKFSMAQDIGIPEVPGAPGTPNVVKGDSVTATCIAYNGVGVAAAALYYKIVSGPHADSADVHILPPGAVRLPNGLLRGLRYDFDPPYPTVDRRSLAEDPPNWSDDYFRPGDVVRYFWWAKDRFDRGYSYPPGITSDPDFDAELTIERAEQLTGGLLEVNFLPAMNWAPSYLAAIRRNPTGNVAPTPEQIATSTQARCILYVNKANTARRSGALNRTSFMYTLDRLGYRYDVYDLQGFGNTNNDLASRAGADQMRGYGLIVLDTGRLQSNTIPDGSNTDDRKVNQAQFYYNYTLSGFQNAYGAATLWMIGENWAFDNRNNGDVMSTMGLVGPSLASDQGLQVSPKVEGSGSFTWINGRTAVFNGAEDQFGLQGCSPLLAKYDNLGQVQDGNPNLVATHKYAKDWARVNAVVMKKNPIARHNAISMGFNWSDLTDTTPSSPDADFVLAGKIVNSLGICLPDTTPTDARPTDDPQSRMMTALHACAPNPFNPSTVIRFDLANEGRVMLRVYDVSGRLVRTLVDRKLPRQRHSVVWDARSEDGQSVASGVYLCRLETTGFTATQKLVVLR